MRSGLRAVVASGLIGLLGAVVAAGPVCAQTQLPTAATPPTDTLLARATTTASGLRYLVRQPGSGEPARPGDRVRVHYTGFLAPDGHLFDASVKQGGPLKVRAGRGEVIRGWDEVLLLLPQGSRARVWIPTHLAYGAAGVRDPDDDARYLVPPNTDLLFELEIVSVR